MTDDYRRVLDAKDVDAVVVTVPDQWHALMTIDACKAGKDVYCEKPLTLVIGEGKPMIDAARKHGRVVQTGTMQRSGEEFKLAVDWCKQGIVGKVKAVNVTLPGPNWIARAGKPVPDSAPPEGFDFDRWLGPAPLRPYNKNRVHYLFRFYWDYSGGQQTNFGAHHLDIAQWGLGMDESGPVSVEGSAVLQSRRLVRNARHDRDQVHLRQRRGDDVPPEAGHQELRARDRVHRRQGEPVRLSRRHRRRTRRNC